MKKFKLHWINSERTDIIEGQDIADAFNRAGYGAGCMKMKWIFEIQNWNTN